MSGGSIVINLFKYIQLVAYDVEAIDGIEKLATLLRKKIKREGKGGGSKVWRFSFRLPPRNICIKD